MTHLPYVAGAYGVTLAMGLYLSIAASMRLRRARRRLDAVDARRRPAP
ncbi:MAG: heme exporter protein CcmD [Janthinobacterium lividum]